VRSGVAQHAPGEPAGARAEEYDSTERCEQLVDLGQLAPELGQGQEDARFVVHEVVRHFVAVGGDLPDEVGVGPHPFPDEEERRPGTVPAQTLSNSGVVVGWGPSSMVRATWRSRVATDATTRDPDSTPASRATGRRAAHAMRQAVAPPDLITGRYEGTPRSISFVEVPNPGRVD
jgi:hypothetical protein